MDILSLPPGDILPYFDTPVITSVSLPISSVITKFASRDPRRVLIAFNLVQSAQTGSWNTQPLPGGFAIQPGGQPLILTYWQHGPLVCSEFWGTSGGGASVTVLTMTAKDWPMDGGNPMAALAPDVGPSAHDLAVQAAKVAAPDTILGRWKALITGRLSRRTNPDK